MTASRDIAARLRDFDGYIITSSDEPQRARESIAEFLEKNAALRREAADEIASLVEELERRLARPNCEDTLPCQRVLNFAAAHTKEHKRAEAAEARLAALEDQNRALEAATIEKCAKVAERTAWDGVHIRRYSDIPDEVAKAIRALASIPGEAG